MKIPFLTARTMREPVEVEEPAGVEDDSRDDEAAEDEKRRRRMDRWARAGNPRLGWI